ncbi:MAG TPA: DUF3857 domain-containing protein [Flavisolibacter sp.]
MKFEIRSITLYVIICLLPFSALAQDDRKYKEEADDIRKEVWAWDRPEFRVQTVPDKYAGVSSVVIARHTEIRVGDIKRMPLMEIDRELVQINDKAAVDKYSRLSYTQLSRGRGSHGKSVVYVGVRVIKPDGSVKEIDADDIVLTKDEKRIKEAEIAVPDLQVGDRLDYFFALQTNKIYENIIFFTFFLLNESPIMHYSIRCDIGDVYGAEYRCYNGAPDFKRTKNDNDGTVLEISKQGIPAYPFNTLWVSAYRQLPLIRMSIMLGKSGHLINSNHFYGRRQGEVFKNPATSQFIEDEMEIISGIKRRYFKPDSARLTGASSRYMNKLKGNADSMHPDSLAAGLFYALRFESFLDISATMDLRYIRGFASKDPFNPSAYLIRLAALLQYSNLKNNFVLLTGKYGPDINSLMSSDDLSYMLTLPGSGGAMMGISDAFSPAFYIPYQLENTPDAITVDTKTNKTFNPRNFEQGTIKIPGSTYGQNSRTEKLVISPSPANGALLVKRTSTLTGHCKPDVQQELILFEDYYEHERKLLGIEKPLLEHFENPGETGGFFDELKAALTEGRENQKEAFVKEAKNWFGTEVDGLTGHKVVNLGVRHDNPDFVYSSEFSLPGVMKKAGDNFIIDIGKLQGTPLKIEGSQRRRRLNVYAPFARSIHYRISIEIPAGYTAEGIADLNRKVENETGAFAAEASLDGNTVIINVSQVYKNALEPYTNWDKMLAFMDASAEWSNAKLLLRKQ